MQRLSLFAISSSIVVSAAAPRAHADAPITITINSNNSAPTPAPVVEAPPSTVEPVCAAAPAPVPFIARRVLMLGLVGGHGSAADSTDDVKTHGLRASIDLVAHRHWAFGVAGTVIARDKSDATTSPRDPIGSNVVAYVAYTHPIGKLDLRFELGAGVGAAPSTTAPAAMTAKATTTTATDDDAKQHDFVHVGEAAITVSRMFGDRWGIAAGPVFTVARPDRADGMTDTDPHPAHTVAFFAAVQRRL